MKKLFLSLGLALSTLLSTNATTLVIENNCHTYVCIQVIETAPISGVNYEYYDGPCGFAVDSNDVFEISDGMGTNRQFPFLNMGPFNNTTVMEETTGGSTGAILPLPPTTDNGYPGTTRYQLQNMKFQLKGANGIGIAPNNAGGVIMNDYAYITGTYVYLPGTPQYEVTFMRMGSVYYFSFNDI